MNKKHCILAASLSLLTTISLWASSQATTTLAKEIIESPDLEEQYRAEIMKETFIEQFGEQEKPAELSWDKFFFQKVAQRNGDYIRAHQKLPQSSFPRYFRGLDLNQLQIKSNIFSNDYDRDFRNTDFSNSNLINSLFYIADFSESNFSDADLTNAHGDYFTCVSTNFSQATMINMRIYWSDFSRANLSNANLAFTILYNVNLTNALVNGANFKDALYKNDGDRTNQRITLNWLREQGAIWDEETPPKTN